MKSKVITLVLIHTFLIKGSLSPHGFLTRVIKQGVVGRMINANLLVKVN